MTRTGLAVRPAAFGEGEARRVRHRLARQHHSVARSGGAWGIQVEGEAWGIQARQVALIPAERREVPEPILGQMENPAVERRPFPVTRAVQMETFLK